jgi:hypothetical protein
LIFWRSAEIEEDAMRRLLAIVLLAISAGPALAGPTCTSEPKQRWLSESAMKAKISEMGYNYRVFKVTTGNCYEIYGRNKTGERIEIYFHPITGHVVEEHKS